MTRDEPWRPIHLIQPVANLVHAVTFEWGIARHDLDAAQAPTGESGPPLRSEPNRAFAHKIGRQVAKDS